MFYPRKVGGKVYLAADMKHFYSKTTFLRNIPLLVLAALAVVQATGGRFGIQALCADLIALSSLLLMFPVSSEEPGRSFPYIAGQSGLYLLVSFTPFFPRNECLLFSLLAMAGLLVHTLACATDRYRNVRWLFRPDSVWPETETFARMFYVLSLGVLGLTCLTASRYEAPAWLFFIFVFILLGFSVLCYIRDYTGSTMLVHPDKEKMIENMIRGNMRMAHESSSDGAEEDHMERVYSKVLGYMETKRPYLDEKFCIDDLADAVFSNKSYLSKAINYFSGRNFRQFVNYYRVMYAVSMMKKDRHLRVVELAMMSGFHSIATFNVAFKLFMNMTPGAYYGVLASQERPHAAMA